MGKGKYPARELTAVNVETLEDAESITSPAITEVLCLIEDPVTRADVVWQKAHVARVTEN